MSIKDAVGRTIGARIANEAFGDRLVAVYPAPFAGSDRRPWHAVVGLALRVVVVVVVVAEALAIVVARFATVGAVAAEDGARRVGVAVGGAPETDRVRREQGRQGASRHGTSAYEHDAEKRQERGSDEKTRVWSG